MSGGVDVLAGTKVRVVRPQCSFGDYAVGDIATVTSVDSSGDLLVTWDAPRHADADKEAHRCSLLYRSEIELAGAQP